MTKKVRNVIAAPITKFLICIIYLMQVEIINVMKGSNLIGVILILFFGLVRV
jgi:hypothetical protein